MKSSVLGYDPIGGARYYGIGNEYMGVIIGALITGVMCLIEESWGSYPHGAALRIGFPVVSLTLGLYLIASPRFGSNFGGALSAYIAFFVTLTLLFEIKIEKKSVVPVFLGVTATLAVILSAIFAKSPPSHISQAFVSVKEQGVISIYYIVQRKLSMNWKLFKYTPWTRALLTTIGASITVFFYPLNFLKRIFNNYPYLHKGFLGSGMGCLVALFVNDSGIVAAATMMIYIALPLFLLVIDEFDTKTDAVKYD